MGLDEVIVYFSELEDPRSEVNRKHLLVSVVVIAMMGVLAGASGPTGIAEWAECKKGLLSKLLPLPNGVPRKDAFRRLLAIGVAMLYCVRDGKETTNTRYYISSLSMGVKRFANAVRSHWGIENTCH